MILITEEMFQVAREAEDQFKPESSMGFKCIADAVLFAVVDLINRQQS
jgi:hypothetical protein